MTEIAINNCVKYAKVHQTLTGSMFTIFVKNPNVAEYKKYEGLFENP